MAKVAYVNPVGKKLKKTKKLKNRRKAKKHNPAVLAALSNGRGRPAKTLTHRSTKMAKPKRAKRSNPKKSRKRRNAWVGESTRHSLAKRTGVAGPVYKAKRVWHAGGKRTNPHKRRKRRNPAGGAGDLFLQLGVTAAAFVGTKVISNLAGKKLGGMLPEGIKPYAKPLVSGAIPVLTYLFGDKVIKNATIKNSIIIGSGLAFIHDASKAFMPQFAMDYLSDVMGETEEIPESAYQRALEYAGVDREPVDGTETDEMNGTEEIEGRQLNGSEEDENTVGMVSPFNDAEDAGEDEGW